jgi:hypothetical protein
MADTTEIELGDVLVEENVKGKDDPPTGLPDGVPQNTIGPPKGAISDKKKEGKGKKKNLDDLKQELEMVWR